MCQGGRWGGMSVIEEVEGRPGPPRVLRVFVSSTFVDMVAERDELVRRVFPQLRELCESRGVVWGEVDLRWGITDERAAEGRVLGVCLEEIRNCRPYFVGILGERYGWVPRRVPEEVLAREPWLAELAGRSVTELEILHGVLNDPGMADHAFFYFRDPAVAIGKPGFLELSRTEEIASYGEVEALARARARSQRLAALKGRIVASKLPVRPAFAGPRELGELVLADLTQVIDSLFPAGSEPSRLDREAGLHDALARSRAEVYVERPGLFERLDERAAGDGEPLVVVGESGVGKSALLANWTLGRQERSRGEDSGSEPVVIAHFVGASPASARRAGLVAADDR